MFYFYILILAVLIISRLKLVYNFTFVVQIFNWISFVALFTINHKWILSTKSGGLYLANKLVNLGILGIKLGQYLHTRSDIINDESKSSIESLLSDNHTHTLQETNEIIKHSLMDKENMYGEYIPITEIKEILGSGSMAQTYECRLENRPEKYVLKVLHPNVENINFEVNVLKFIIRILKFMKTTIINIEWDSFFENIIVQQDLRNEARNIEIFYNIYKNYPKIEIPKMIFATKEVLVMSFIEGETMNKITNRESDGYKKAYFLLTSSFLQTMQKHRICHGDLHMGNIIVKPNTDIALIDFGIVIKAKSKDESMALYYFRKAYNNPSIANYHRLLSQCIYPTNIHEKSINIDTCATNLYTFFKEKKCFFVDEETKIIKTNLKYKINDFLKDLKKFIQENQLIFIGRVLYFITQATILEGMCPRDVFEENPDDTRAYMFIRTISFMKKEMFFVNECGFYLKRFYDNQLEQVPEYVSRKYP